MTTNDQRLAQALRQSNDAVIGVPDSPEARARAVAAIQAAMQAAPPAAPRARGWLAIAALIPVLIGAGWWLRAERSALGKIEETGARLWNGAPVESGQVVLTLALRDGVKVTLEPMSEVELRDLGSTVLVRRGAVAAEVITREQPFTVEAFDTIIATRAARFAVSSKGCDGRAEVRVSEGSVSVGGVMVQAGETWPGCGALTPPAPAQLEPEAVVVTPSPEVVKKPAPPAPPRQKEESREDRLAKQNALYQQAIALQRAGDVAGAVSKLEAVLKDEHSPLAETALAQKMKWLTATDRSAARETAREYLQRFPMGFGRADAETLVLEPK